MWRHSARLGRGGRPIRRCRAQLLWSLVFQQGGGRDGLTHLDPGESVQGQGSFHFRCSLGSILAAPGSAPFEAVRPKHLPGLREAFPTRSPQAPRVKVDSTSIRGARTLLGAPGLTTRSKKLLGAKDIATRSKDATRVNVWFGDMFGEWDRVWSRFLHVWSS